MNKELNIAVRTKNVKRAEELLKGGADPDYCDGRRLLTWAVEDLEMFKLLVKHGANVNKDNGVNWFPIHEASWNNNKIDVLSFLLEAGANINVKSGGGNTPLHLALINSQDQIAKRLLEDDNIDLEIQNKKGEYPIDLAKNKEIEKLVLSKIYEVNKKKFEESRKVYKENRVKFVDVAKKIRAIDMSRIVKEIEEKQSEIVKLDIDINELNVRLTQVLTQRNQFEEERVKLVKEQEDLQKEEEIEEAKNVLLIEKDYECPVCLIVPYAPKQIVLCKNGHSMSSPCKEKLEICPICQVDLGTTGRNFWMEKLLAESQLNEHNT